MVMVVVMMIVTDGGGCDDDVPYLISSREVQMRRCDLTVCFPDKSLMWFGS